MMLLIGFNESTKNRSELSLKRGTFGDIFFDNQIMEDTMLTELQYKNFQPQEKSYKKFNNEGMFLLIKPNENKYWHLKYKYAGKEKQMSLEVYHLPHLKNIDQFKFLLLFAENIFKLKKKKTC